MGKGVERKKKRAEDRNRDGGSEGEKSKQANENNTVDRQTRK